jgi:hypothetical protein
MEMIVAEGIHTFIDDYTKGLFNDPRCSGSQETILAGLALALKRYEQTVGKPLLHALALNLLDAHDDSTPPKGFIQ